MIEGYVYSTEDEEEPYILVKDDDSHWFLIPEYNKEVFECMRDEGDCEGINKNFSQNMIDNPSKLRILKWT